MVRFNNTTLTKADVRGLIAHETGGEPHLAVAGEPLFYDDNEKARVNQLIKNLRAELETEVPQDVYDPSLAETCDLLANPPEAVFGWIQGPDGEITLYIAETPWFGTIAATEGDQVWLTTVDPRDMSRFDRVGRYIDTEGGLYKSNVAPITMLDTELRDALDGFGARADVKRAAYLIEAKPYWAGEFHVEYWNERDGRRVSAEPVRVYGIEDADTDFGIFTLTAKQTHHGRELTLAPANGSDVARLLTAERHDLELD